MDAHASKTFCYAHNADHNSKTRNSQFDHSLKGSTLNNDIFAFSAITHKQIRSRDVAFTQRERS